MNKKKWIIVAGAAITVCAAASATQIVELVQTSIMDSADSEFQMSDELSVETAERRSLIEAALIETAAEEAVPVDKYSKMLAALDATIENPAEYNIILYNYEYLRTAYKLTDEQLDYIADLIIGGYDAREVIEICYFWLNTNESIDIVGEIYAINDRFIGHSWIENAFNRVTSDKCGVLDEEGVEEYLKKGAKIDDIVTANQLCRKGVLTIQEILDMRLDGVSFSEIAAQIEGLSYTEPERNAVVLMSEDESEEADENPLISGQEVLKAVTLSKMEGEAIDEYFREVEDGENLEEKLEALEEAYDEEIETDLRSRGMYKTVTKEDVEQYEEQLEEGR